MGECCDPGAYENTLGARFARRSARRYRRRGLNRTQRSIVDFLARRGGLDGASVLEVGGGIGDLYIELLRRGASTVTNLEISTGYEAEATALLSESGMASRVTRRLHDIAIDSEAVESADVVVLHRVVCAIRTTSGSSGRRPATHDGCWSSLTRRALRLSAHRSRSTIWSGDCGATISAALSTHPRPCTRWRTPKASPSDCTRGRRSHLEIDELRLVLRPAAASTCREPAPGAGASSMW